MILAVCPENYRGCKKPALWMQDGNRMRKLATFAGEEERRIFVEYMKKQGCLTDKPE